MTSRCRFCRRRANWAEWIERWCAEPAEDRGVVMTCLLADATGVLDRVNGDDELVRGRSTPHAATRWHAGDAA